MKVKLEPSQSERVEIIESKYAQHEARRLKPDSSLFVWCEVYLFKLSANQQAVGHVFAPKMLEITNNVVLVSMH